MSVFVHAQGVKTVHAGSVRPKPLFWFRSNTETETQIGRYFRYKMAPKTKFAAKF